MIWNVLEIVGGSVGFALAIREALTTFPRSWTVAVDWPGEDCPF